MADLKKKLLRKVREFLGYPLLSAICNTLVDIEMKMIKDEIRSRDPDAFILHGYKVYSQCDEDGIIDRIFQQIGERTRLFVEVGCGNGLENNTHYLLLKGWRGVWMDGNPENVSFIQSELEYRANSVLSVSEAFITTENANALVREGLQNLGVENFPAEIDLLSLDIDGNDLYVIQSLEVIRPRVICVEYNSRFPPPLEIAIRYRPGHRYASDDYQGTSLQSLANVLSVKGYRLAVCSISGVNAFFVRSSELSALKLGDVGSLYQPPRHHLCLLKPGLAASLKFARDRISGARTGGV